MNAPCYQCEKRCDNLHSACEDYKDFSEERAEACARKKLYSRTCAYFIDRTRARRKNYLKKRGLL